MWFENGQFSNWISYETPAEKFAFEAEQKPKFDIMSGVIEQDEIRDLIRIIKDDLQLVPFEAYSQCTIYTGIIQHTTVAVPD